VILAAWVLLALVSGSLVYCVLVLRAAAKYLAVRPEHFDVPVPLSVLKPCAGIDEGLEENLRTFFEQDYPAYELLFAVRTPSDPASFVIQKLRGEYADVPSRLIVTGEPPYPNAKVYSLDRMTRAAAYDVLVMSDSDVRVTPGFLSAMAAEFSDPWVAISTCPYRAVAGASFWTRLEAIGMNTEFLAGVLVARMLEGMKFALGPTLTARRQTLEDIGGWDYLKDFLAEDFVIGHRAAELGRGVILSSYVIEHRIGSQPLRTNFAHRQRWNRSTRRSRPAGYIGELFTNPLPLALFLVAVRPAWWPVLALTVVLRFAAAYATAGLVLRDRITMREWWLIPVQDLLSFGFWVAGFFGNTIAWRGRIYILRRDGRFELLPAAENKKRT
jgi:ceramide glucosyltransferase